MAEKRLHASGRLRDLALSWWNANHKSSVTAIYVKGDGYLRFQWRDKAESGAFHIPIETLFAVPAPAKETIPNG